MSVFELEEYVDCYIAAKQRSDSDTRDPLELFINKNSRWSWKDFKFYQIVGKGSEGEVSMAQDRITG